MWLAHKLVRGSDQTKILKRLNEDLDDADVTTFNTFWSLVVIVLSRSKYTYRISIKLDRLLADIIGKKAAKFAVKNNADAVICFSMNEKVCFEYLKKHAPHIKRIVDCANSPVDYMRKLYDLDMAHFNHSILKQEVPQFWKEKDLEKQQQGIDVTEYFLAPSNFVRKGLQSCQVCDDRIFVVNYGSNFAIGSPQINIPKDIRFIYVGQVTFRKGMHHLLKVFSEFPNVHLDIVGAWKPDSVLIEKYGNNPNFSFHGHVSHDRVKQLLENANIFVFDSLSEGFSLSCMEALSCGLPLIVSENSGVNDLVIDGKNGFVINPDNEDDLRMRIKWFIDNKDQIPSMSKNAIITASNNTWEQYGDKLKRILDRLCQQ